jgi:hypothetical protein
MVKCQVQIDDASTDFDVAPFVDVQITTVEDYIQLFAGQRLTTDEKNTWFLDNTDIAQSLSLEIYTRNGLHTYVMNVDEGSLIMTDRNHLKYAMKNLPVQSTWVHSNHVLIYDGHALPMRRTASGVVAEVYCYDNEAYERCAKDISAERIGLASLNETISKLRNEGRGVDSLVSAYAERQSTLERLCEQLANCDANALLMRTLIIGPEVLTKQMATPPTLEVQDTFGLVQPHLETTHYLKNGCYNVSTFYMEKQEIDYTLMDFVTMSRCLVCEGTRMWITVDVDILSLWTELGFTLSDSALADDVLADEMMVQVSGFYTLGGTEEGQHIRTAKVSMMVRISGLGLQKLPCSVFGLDGGTHISLHKSGALRCFDELVPVDDVAV